MNFRNIILVAFIGCLAAITACIAIRNNIVRYGHGQFERGAWAVATYHKAFGNYGSMCYRDRVFFSHEDPQDSADIVKLMAAENNCGSVGNSVQQPKERSFSMDSLKWYHHSGHIILSTHVPRDGDSAFLLYYCK
jgi:hypothetical protein